MSTEIVKQQMPVTEIMSIGKAFVESGMFPDVKSVAMAVVKIQAGQELGVAPFAAMSGIYIIAGRATVGAGIIAAKIKGSGKYTYKVVEHTDKICSIDIYQGKVKEGNSSFTLDEARKAGTKNMEKHPKNMLFARAISNAVKWFCPDVFNQAVYTPEEMEGVTEDAAHEVVASKLTVVPEEKKQEEKGQDNVTIGTAQKPLITNGQYKLLCERVQNGDTKAYWNSLAVFSFEPFQKSSLDNIFNSIQTLKTA